MTKETTTPTPSEGFGNLGLDAKLLSALRELGYEEPTPIQRESIPPLLTGRDLIGQAATGTGKTAAFALPMLQRIAESGKDRAQPSALILVPTRELAMQVAEAIHKYGHALKVSVMSIYGGHSFSQQARMLERGIDVVVATPGRVVDHIKRKTLDLSGIAILTLDEADEMLDMGFADDLEVILSETPAERQTVFFSATLPPRIAGMVKRHLRDPLRIQIAPEPVARGAIPKVRQTAYIVPRIKKLDALGRILDMENPASALVFCRTRIEVDNLTDRLSAHGYRAQALHGGITQDQRTMVIKRLREGKIELVIATDVAARGLDIEQLALVVNYDVPATPDSYVHRIGRVGRAGREGVAITLADPRESRLLRQFELLTKGKINIAQVPTVADLQARRLELTCAALREALAAGGLDRYRVAVESLAQEHDLMEVALAAVKLAHQACIGDQEDESAEPVRSFAKYVAPPKPAPIAKAPHVAKSEPVGKADPAEKNEPVAKPAPTPKAEPAAKAHPLVKTPPAVKAEPNVKPEPPAKALPAPKAEPVAKAPPAVKAEPSRDPNIKMARIYIGVGKLAGILPQNLSGAITGLGIKGNLVGTIEIQDKYSIVELPDQIIDDVVRQMRDTLIKGKRYVTRRFVEK